MLNIRDINHLSKILDLDSVLLSDNYDRYISSFVVQTKNKKRKVHCVHGPLRHAQQRLLKLFISKLKPSRFSHGGIKGRSPLTNAGAHSSSRFFFQTDIKNFYPSISHHRVYETLFSLGCSREVCRLMTRLTTFEKHLAQGMITSPFLAEQVFRSTDRRISILCGKRKLCYTRFVDDLTISGAYDLRKSNLKTRIGEIIETSGFGINHEKTFFSTLEEGPKITGIRIRKNRKLDISRDYLWRLAKILNDAEKVSIGKKPELGFHSEDQIIGKAQFAIWVNPGRRKHITNRLASINWASFWNNAVDLGLCVKEVDMQSAKRAEKEATLHEIAKRYSAINR